MNILKKSLKYYLTVCLVAMAFILPGTTYIYTLVTRDLPDMNELKPKVMSDAAEFAKGHTDKECIPETMRKIKPCGINDYGCRITGKIFLKDCLENAKSTATFCDGFPRGGEEANTGKWKVNICLDHKEIHNIVCTNTFEAAEEYCASKIR